MNFEILTVAQNGYRSDVITAVQRHIKSIPGRTHWNGVSINRQFTVTELRISVDVKSTVTIQEYDNDMLKNQIVFEKCDISSLIQCLQDVQTFISEEKMVEKLMGRR